MPARDPTATFANMSARIVVGGKLVGHVRVALNERAGVTAKEAKALADIAADGLAAIIEEEQSQPEG